MFYLIGIIAFLFDRIFKFIALSYISNEGVVLIPKILSLKFYKNFGAAFGLKIPVDLIILLSLIILLGVGYHVISPRFAAKSKTGYPTPKSMPRLILLFLTLGATSNIFDRIYYGYVIDYFSLFNYSFFNLADLMIIFSLGFVLYYYWKK